MKKSLPIAGTCIALALCVGMTACVPQPVERESGQTAAEAASPLENENSAPAAVVEPIPVASDEATRVAGTVTVNASSEVKAVPDRASFSVDVVVQGETAEDAQSAASEPVDAVMAALSKLGIEDKSIQTTYTGVSPLYDWSGETQRIVGYESRTSITVSDVAVDDVTAAMEACVTAGATSTSGPNYYASSYDDAYAQALAQAIEASRVKAAVMAEAAGVSLGEVVSITEGYQNTSYRYVESAAAMEMAVTVDEAGAGAAKLAPGEVSIEAQVTVTYALG